MAHDPIRLRDALADLVGLLEADITEYQGRTYATPSLIDHDDGTENDH